MIAEHLNRGQQRAGRCASFEYSKKTDPRNAVENIEYDAAGRATRELLPENGIQQFA